jgi:Ca-activated chloride channel family protein
MTVKLRYKAPEGDTSRMLSFAIGDAQKEPSAEARFVAGVVEFGLLLRDSPHKGSANWNEVLELARAGAGDDQYRREFVELVKRAQSLE